MIIYIHGFGSSGMGGKSCEFRNYFKSQNINFIAPSLSYVPDLAIATLEELIESYDEEIHLIGSSLGGYYCLYLAHKYNLKAVLINPSTKPYITLDAYKGEAYNYYDESHFIWNTNHINMLKSFETEIIFHDNILLLLQKGDESLDYKTALNLLIKSKSIVEDGGNHSFLGINRHFKRITSFFNTI